jgi:hypothetical protein
MELGSDLVETDPALLCRRVLADAGWPATEIVLLDGVRHVSVVHTIRSIIAPAEFRLVMVDASPESRQKRFKHTNNADISIKQIDAHAVSKDTDALSRIADYHADGDADDNSIVATLTSLIGGWLLSTHQTK